MPNNDFMLEIKLRQHTPLIHFQGQSGATLRATELKPKLDKWIISQKNGWSQIPSSWKMSNKSDQVQSLNYKISIHPSKLVNSEVITSYQKIPQFFANMGNTDRTSQKYFSETDGLIKVKLFTFDKELKNYLEANIAQFFATHNFGSRQNKGFGSFEDVTNTRLYNSTPQNASYINIDINKQKYDFLIEKEIDFWEVALKAVNFYYQKLKSGINHSSISSSYQESFLRKFSSYKWEKKWMKVKFLGLDAPLTGEENFYRFYLGMPFEYRYKIAKASNKSKNKNFEIKDNYVIKVTHPAIDRYKSPITFKPFITMDHRERKGLIQIYIVLNEPSFTKEMIKDLEKPFQFQPFFSLRIASRWKEQRGRERLLYTEKEVPVDYLDKGKFTDNEIKNFKRIVKKSIEFENEKMEEDSNTYSEVNGQTERFKQFTKNMKTENLKAPLKVHFDLVELIKSYHKEISNFEILFPQKNNSPEKIKASVIIPK